MVLMYSLIPYGLCGGIAQLARVLGSYPIGRQFESDCRYFKGPVGQAVKTSPFHGGIMGSIPVRVTRLYARKHRRYVVSESFFYLATTSVLYLSFIQLWAVLWVHRTCGSRVPKRSLHLLLPEPARINDSR